VAGIFSREAGSGDGYALGLVETGSGKAFTMAFDEAARTVPARQTASMIEVPPGEYRIAYWATYGWLFKQESSRKDFPPEHVLARPFKVKPGRVVVIGNLLAATQLQDRKVTWSIVPQKVGAKEVVAAFRQGFPGFEQAPVTCILCLPDGAPSAPESQAGAPAAAAAP
jgi:hypothetical protein